ncbi:ATPase, T2SS/T4P/T4SS family [uncultured Clostridium sp.]|uniref:ATPase, T2SS/T4P/T4SS family n=1 Tax=uncultured Clostridium sp. TaxID=59620 RepID=UPI0026F4073A|nr:ATPase, T2SS/T4P/T4SS family [uncultured Clostridium sp.]
MGVIDKFSFSLETLPIDKRLSTSFKDIGLVEGENYVYALELYKIYPNANLVNSINNLIGLVDYIVSVDNIARSDYYRDIERDFDVLVEIDSFGKYNVYCNMFNDIESYRLILAMNIDDYNLNICRLTPYNWRKLKGLVSDDDYNSSILFRRIILDGVEQGATDIHFEHKMIRNREKSEFELHAFISMTRNKRYLEYNTFKLQPRHQSKMLKDIVAMECPNSTNDLDFAGGISTSIADLFGDSTVTLRFTGKPLTKGHSVCIRIQNMKTVSLTIPQLGFPSYQQDILERIANRESGLTLITGEMGSGKNTTQFAIANSMLSRPIKIQDFSSPVEVYMPIAQVDYDTNVEILLHLCRLAKKEATDVILLNEIPDKSVAFAVQDLVNSSVHVITTTHVDRVWQVPYKLEELYGEGYKNIISSLNAIITQKMFVKQCPYCADRQVIMGTKLLYLEEFMQEMGHKFHYRNTGCPRCENGNLIDSIQPYCEMILLNDEIKSNLLNCKTPYEMEAYLKDYMLSNKLSFEFSLTQAIDDGKIKIESLTSII